MRDAIPFLFVAGVLGAGCGGGGDGDATGETPILEPEPSGAPTEQSDPSMPCLGENVPGAVSGTTIQMVGYVRFFSDPDADNGAPGAEVEAFDLKGTSLGSGFSDKGNGRATTTVPVRDEGFTGYVAVRLDGYVETRFFSNLPVTNTDADDIGQWGGWVWMMTQEELDGAAAVADLTLDSQRGVVVGAVHACDELGVANIVAVVGGSSDGVVYFDGFDPAPGTTFSDASGRFAVANVEPGDVPVEAYGRTEAGGPLVLLGRADVQVAAGVITAVDLRPRMGVDR